MSVLNVPDRVVQSELDNVKKFIEARGTADGAWRGTVE
jgi:hypothetical protein